VYLTTVFILRPLTDVDHIGVKCHASRQLACNKSAQFHKAAAHRELLEILVSGHCLHRTTTTTAYSGAKRAVAYPIRV